MVYDAYDLPPGMMPWLFGFLGVVGVLGAADAVWRKHKSDREESARIEKLSPWERQLSHRIRRKSQGLNKFERGESAWLRGREPNTLGDRVMVEEVRKEGGRWKYRVSFDSNGRKEMWIDEETFMSHE